MILDRGASFEVCGCVTSQQIKEINLQGNCIPLLGNDIKEPCHFIIKFIFKYLYMVALEI